MLKKSLLALTALFLVGMFISSPWAAADSGKELNRLTVAEQQLGFELLFDGNKLCPEIWKSAIEGYPVQDQVFSCQKGGDLLTKKNYDNFVFRFEFKLPPKGNNGVGLRVPAKGHPSYDGMESQILADDYENAQIWQKHGSIYGCVPAKLGALKPNGEWNVEEIVMLGTKVQVIVNGKTIVDADLSKVEPIDNHAHPGLKRTTGAVGFLGHHDPVSFRNVRILKIQDENDLNRVRALEKAE